MRERKVRRGDAVYQMTILPVVAKTDLPTPQRCSITIGLKKASALRALPEIARCR
jgi:hypothetical protein